MNQAFQHTGFAIAIAWPETYCKQPGYWYDGLLRTLGVSTNHYYKAGHAALVLINPDNKCYYFDFGRYHAPFQHGRVRSEITDHGLKVNTLARVSNNQEQIENFEEILTELQLNHECHGEGTIYASYCKIDFEKAFHKALQLQQSSPLPYGPFQYKGSNCSRFVNTSILAGNPPWSMAFKLKHFVVLTPTPLNNVNALANKVVIPKLIATEPFNPAPIPDKHILKYTLQAPTRPHKLPANAHWFSGEGAGSWFSINQNSDYYQISRFGPQGEPECTGNFKISKQNSFDLNAPFHLSYLSHCQKVVVEQGGEIVVLERMVE
jgi:hypothetical protein